ncbi:hypothetical protein AWC06_00445 [Mycobacterium fragae]|uniref:Uncharacterized protein n=1 Tax=Mycobacterium fragae TaxID=1260918 RepID=A0A1X1UJA4_9MYCO|nr:hypothetical protein AWC06_00445 [Mycobacterium fragae]
MPGTRGTVRIATAPDPAQGLAPAAEITVRGLVRMVPVLVRMDPVLERQGRTVPAGAVMAAAVVADTSHRNVVSPA